MKLVRGPLDEDITITFSFLGMMKETANTKKSFLLNIRTSMGKYLALPVLDNAVREFLFLISWAETQDGIRLVPCGPHLPRDARIRVPVSDKVKNWNNVGAAIIELARKYTEGFMITFERGEHCDEIIC